MTATVHLFPRMIPTARAALVGKVRSFCGDCPSDVCLAVYAGRCPFPKEAKPIPLNFDDPLGPYPLEDKGTKPTMSFGLCPDYHSPDWCAKAGCPRRDSAPTLPPRFCWDYLPDEETRPAKVIPFPPRRPG